jgi:hypothetical protein
MDRRQEIVEHIEQARAGPSPEHLFAAGHLVRVLRRHLSNMTLDTLVAQSSFGLALEDMFVSRGSLENKHARAERLEDAAATRR